MKRSAGSQRQRAVLAFSGGLDTSVALRWLKERGYDVIAYVADVGQGGNFASLRSRAKQIGASKVVVEDLKRTFAERFILPALQARAVYESKYVLATALSRPLIAERLVAVARREGAKAVAHGCTGKGNDQVRFEVTTHVLAPELRVVAPVREWELRSREDEVAYAKSRAIPLDLRPSQPYSIDQNLWGVSIECGVLEDPWVEPPSGAYRMTKSPAEAPGRPAYVEVQWTRGVPTHLNGRRWPLVALIERLNQLGGSHGVGRSDLVENRLVGIKSREIYEAPAATILLEAHHALEALVLDRTLSHFKAGLASTYAELVYTGLWHTPLREALDAFVSRTQRRVSGITRVRLFKGTCQCVGRKSRYSLYQPTLATYGEEDRFDRTAAKGFIQLWAMPYGSHGAGSRED